MCGLVHLTLIILTPHFKAYVLICQIVDKLETNSLHNAANITSQPLSTKYLLSCCRQRDAPCVVKVGIASTFDVIRLSTIRIQVELVTTPHFLQ